MAVLMKILQVVLALSLLVLVHEFGHYFFARLFKIKVEKFYLFFDAGFALFKWKPKKSDTEYGIGWLPLGGYCKIAGMIDESMDKDQIKAEPQPWEFRSKKDCAYFIKYPSPDWVIISERAIHQELRRKYRYSHQQPGTGNRIPQCRQDHFI